MIAETSSAPPAPEFFNALGPSPSPSVPYLQTLEEEAIYILRETTAQFERPALLFSGGKDSITLVHLACKAFQPGAVPFPLLLIDTGHNFPETLRFCDELARRLGVRLLVRSVQDSIDQGRVREETGRFPSRNALQTVTLLDAIDELRLDACIGGARRDEEKARAKERVFSVRDEFGQWNPKLQRPELWNLYNGRIHPGENVRIFPLSNWTELDVWRYLQHEEVPVPSLYFAHSRRCFLREGQWFPVSPFVQLDESLQVEEKIVRFRTVGDMTCTAAVESTASDVEAILQEIQTSSQTERGSRLDDRRSESAMETRKLNGYF
jgi:sulfate adenylyltransferase subunit 2